MLLAARNEMGAKVLWKILVQRCLCETNREALTGLVHQAEEAMFLRSQELTEEEEELRLAARQMLELKTKRLGWPDPLKVDTEFSESA